MRFHSGRSRDPVAQPEPLSPPEAENSPGHSAFQKSAGPAIAERFVDVIEAPIGLPRGLAISKDQQDLVQKDELINALVHELEQAVEQLDRFHRTGASGSRGGAATPAISPAMASIEPPSLLMDDLRRLVEHLDQTQPGSVLVRMESQLAAIHELVSELHRGERTGLDDGDASNRSRQRLHESEILSQESLNPPISEGSASNWEAIKSKMRIDEAPCQSAESRAEDSELLKLLSETPTPHEIDFVASGLDELKSAIVERDAYIIQLNRLFRTRNTLSLPDDWASLAHVPGEMHIRVESLIEHLDVQVRLGEVEMSLERARLARERSQIQSEREHIQKHLKRLGLSSIADLDNISATTGTAGDRRWMRFLGPNAK